ncbi:MAG: hypothetical protein ACMXYK_00880 [Candidatus Woesearchaeota archaeon]
MSSLPSKIDPELTTLDMFGDYRMFIYLVEKKHSKYVFKCAKASKGYLVQHVHEELCNLKRAQNVEGITHLVREYPSCRFYAYPFLKEYFEGNALNETDPSVIDSSVEKSLEKTILSLNSNGFCNLDIHYGNILVNEKTKETRFIDLGKAVYVPLYARINPVFAAFCFKDRLKLEHVLHKTKKGAYVEESQPVQNMLPLSF